jgi:hypothetical protein
MSASAPEGAARTQTGRLVAAWTSVIIRTEADWSVISQAAVAFCIQVPMFETNEAIHRPWKTVRRRGDRAEG